MIDMIGIYIPFRPETFGYTHHEQVYDNIIDKTSRVRVFDILEICKQEKIEPNAYGLCFDISDDGSNQFSFHGLNVPFEQLESSFSGIAMKVNHAPTIGTPHVQLKASPAKLLLGHNIFGFDDIKSGVEIMLYTLLKKYPYLSKYLDFHLAEIRMLDITYSFRMKSKNEALYLLDYLRNVSYGQTKARKAHYDSTIYFGSSDSKHKFLRLYYKYDELIKTLQSKTKQQKNNITEQQLSIISDKELLEFAQNLLRVEAALRKEWISKKFGSCLLKDVLYSDVCLKSLWSDAMSDLFKAVGDVTLRNQSDEAIRESINDAYVTYNKKTGKPSFANANNIYSFYRLIVSDGYDSVKETTAHATFHRRLKQLENIGISRAQLQNYKSIDSNTRNIIPFVKIIDMTQVVESPVSMPDYKKQFDSDYYDLVSHILKKAV